MRRRVGASTRSSERGNASAALHVEYAETRLPARHGPTPARPALLGSHVRSAARCVMRGAHAMRGLYAIADTAYLSDARLALAVEEALRGGAKVMQYRDKSHAPEERLRQARAVRAICAKHGACFIVNDDV